MIKCNVTICGTISRSAQIRTNKEGKSILYFGVNVVIPAKSGINKTVEISVAKEGEPEEIINYPPGTRIAVAGTLTFRKKGEAMYFNMAPTTMNQVDVPSEDSVKGDIEFRGSLGKKIDARTDKKGNPFCIFSAYSGEKVGDNFEFIWVRFMHFGTSLQPWMQPKANIQAKGELQLDIFNDRLDISCRVLEVAPWEKKPYNQNT